MWHLGIFLNVKSLHEDTVWLSPLHTFEIHRHFLPDHSYLPCLSPCVQHSRAVAKATRLPGESCSPSRLTGKEVPLIYHHVTCTESSAHHIVGMNVNEQMSRNHSLRHQQHLSKCSLFPQTTDISSAKHSFLKYFFFLEHLSYARHWIKHRGHKDKQE